MCTTPYGLYLLPSNPTIVAYENDIDAVQAAIDVLWGKLSPEGCLPIPLNKITFL